MVLSLINIRLGFACNSSSSHSLLILKAGEHKPDSNISDAEDYGWEEFILVDPDEKMKYFAQQLHYALRNHIGPEFSRSCVRDFTGIAPTDTRHIDHDSVMTLPISHHEFLADVKSMLLRDDVVILGGNDNERTAGFPVGDRRLWHLPTEGRYKRFDHDGTWTIFNPKTGTKLRLSLTNKTAAELDGVKALTPELVDVKITDYCGRNCLYCYQDSTVHGMHANEEVLSHLAYMLKDLGVFEVALGGGEPTAHPNFSSIIANFSHGMVANFTTRNLEWCAAHASELSCVGSIAYSVDDKEDIDRLVSLACKHPILEPCNRDAWTRDSGGKIVIQHVVGATTQDRLFLLLEHAKKFEYPVTLLGWKSHGRGMAGALHNVDWQKAVDKAGLYSVRIDTALAAQTNMTEYKREQYSKYEGAVSAYIDAVKMVAAPSSYCSKEDYIDMSKYISSPTQRESSPGAWWTKIPVWYHKEQAVHQLNKRARR